MVGNILQVFSLLAVLVTIYFASLQTKRLREQITVSNLFSRYEALNHASERYDAALALIFERPDLRPYIFDRKKPDLGTDDHARALIVADLMAGAVDYAIRVESRFPDTGADWVSVAAEMARQPLIQELVLSRPHEFPDLVPFFGTDEEGNRVEPRVDQRHPA